MAVTPEPTVHSNLREFSVRSLISSTKEDTGSGALRITAVPPSDEKAPNPNLF